MPQIAATGMDLERVILSEVRQRKTNILWYCLYVESLKNGTNEPIYKSEIVTDVENKLMVTKEKGGKDKLGDWDWHIQLLYIK